MYCWEGGVCVPPLCTPSMNLNEEYEHKIKKQKKEDHDRMKEDHVNHLNSMSSTVSLQDLLAEEMKSDCIDLR